MLQPKPLSLSQSLTFPSPFLFPCLPLAKAIKQRQSAYSLTVHNLSSFQFGFGRGVLGFIQNYLYNQALVVFFLLSQFFEFTFLEKDLVRSGLLELGFFSN